MPRRTSQKELNRRAALPPCVLSIKREFILEKHCLEFVANAYVNYFPLPPKYKRKWIKSSVNLPIVYQREHIGMLMGYTLRLFPHKYVSTIADKVEWFTVLPIGVQFAKGLVGIDWECALDWETSFGFGCAVELSSGSTTVDYARAAVLRANISNANMP